MALRRPDAAVGADEVRCDQILEAILRAGRVRAADARVRDQSVDRAEPGGRARESLVDGAALADVAGEALNRACKGLRGLLEAFAVAGEQRERRALRREPLRDRAPDSRPGAGDDGVPAGEAPGVYQPRVSRSSSGASVAVERPLIASPRPCETRASTSASA